MIPKEVENSVKMRWRICEPSPLRGAGRGKKQGFGGGGEAAAPKPYSPPFSPRSGERRGARGDERGQWEASSTGFSLSSYRPARTRLRARTEMKNSAA
jgi:hypothetical protein